MSRFTKLLLTLSFLVGLVAFTPVAGASGAQSSTVRWFQPIMELPKPAIATFTCIIRRESTSTWLHPNLGDNNADGGSSGIFQIESPLWDEWAPRAGIHVRVWQATPYQQAKVAATIYHYDGFGRWADDGCV